jgi:hypothetical protein
MGLCEISPIKSAGLKEKDIWNQNLWHSHYGKKRNTQLVGET